MYRTLDVQRPQCTNNVRGQRFSCFMREKNYIQSNPTRILPPICERGVPTMARQVSPDFNDFRYRERDPFGESACFANETYTKHLEFSNAVRTDRLKHVRAFSGTGFGSVFQKIDKTGLGIQYVYGFIGGSSVTHCWFFPVNLTRESNERIKKLKGVNVEKTTLWLFKTRLKQPAGIAKKAPNPGQIRLCTVPSILFTESFHRVTALVVAPYCNQTVRIN